jgi:hypothetical protein
MSARVEDMVRVLEQIASYLKTIDHACVYGIEETEDNVLTANFFVSGFDGFMLSEVQRIASQHNARVGFSVEPYSSKTLKLILVIEVASG